MYEKSIKTSTGKEFEVRFCGTTSIGIMSVLYIEFIGKTIPEIAVVFSDKSETETIYGYVSGELAKVFKDYTNLAEVLVVEGNNIRIRLDSLIDEL